MGSISDESRVLLGKLHIIPALWELNLDAIIGDRIHKELSHHLMVVFLDVGVGLVGITDLEGVTLTLVILLISASNVVILFGVCDVIGLSSSSSSSLSGLKLKSSAELYSSSLLFIAPSTVQRKMSVGLINHTSHPEPLPLLLVELLSDVHLSSWGLYFLPKGSSWEI